MYKSKGFTFNFLVIFFSNINIKMIDTKSKTIDDRHAKPSAKSCDIILK